MFTRLKSGYPLPASKESNTRVARPCSAWLNLRVHAVDLVGTSYLRRRTAEALQFLSGNLLSSSQDSYHDGTYHVRAVYLYSSTRLP